jgi:hypothetical protein
MDFMDYDQLMGVFQVIGAVLFVFILILVVSMWNIFTKAGQEGWKAIIPIYNMVVLMEIIRKPWWWILLMLIPYVGIIWSIWSMNLLSKSFGKGTGFTVGLVLLSIVFFPILAFDDSEYTDPTSDGYSY